MQSWKLHQYAKLITITCMLLCLILGGFQSIWVMGGSASSIMLQVGLQRSRAQAITKDVLILLYRPQSEHVIAISELQTILPLWEKTQQGLQQGNTALQLPMNIPMDISTLTLQALPDFLAMDTAVNSIVSHTGKNIDPVQASIVLLHQPMYSETMSELEITWKQHIDDAFLHIFIIESSITGVILLLLILIFILRQIEHRNVRTTVRTDMRE